MSKQSKPVTTATSTTRTLTARVLLVLLVLITAFGALSATARADQLEILPESVMELLDWEVELGVIELIPFNATATAEANCDTGTIDVTVSNKTVNYYWIDIYADDVFVGSGELNPGAEQSEQIPADENQAIHVMVGVIFAETALLDEVITLDCLAPLPAYQILTSCETGQAHARLINHGDDTALLGVQYPDVMHMEIEVAPHSSEDWLLAVSPGESIDFDIVSNNVAIGSEHLDFVCEVAEEPANTPVDQPVEPVEPAEAIEEAVAQEPAPVVPTQEPAAPTTVDQPAPVPTEDTDIDTNDAAGDELAAGSDLLIGTDNSGNGMALGIVLIGIGLATLTAVALVTTRRRAES